MANMEMTGMMESGSYSEGRKCAICGSPITDGNPDGIGCGCREVYNKAYISAVFHFNGLEIWKEKARLYIDTFISAFEKTKFRTAFNKSFFESIKKQKDTGEYRISKKQLDIISNKLFGDIYGGGYPKITDELILKDFDITKKEITRKAIEDFKKNITTEQNEYVINLTKKYYSELQYR